MAPYRRSSRPNEGYRVQPTLQDGTRLGPLQTGLRNRAQAVAIESWLKECDVVRPAVIDGLREGRFTLKQLWRAKVASTKGRDRVAELLLAGADPLLAAAAAAMAKKTADDRVAQGLRVLAGLAESVERARAAAAEAAGEKKARVPKEGSVRLSWLLTPANVTELYEVAEDEGRSPNSVYRSIHRAVADLLAHHYGKARRNEVFVEVAKPGADDVRTVRVNGDELRRVLAECGPDFADLAALAMLLAVDRLPILRITPRVFDDAAASVEVLDYKTGNRLRVLALSAPAAAILRRRCARRALDEPIFNYTPDQVRHQWEAARDHACGITSRNRRDRGQVDPVREAARALLAAQGIVTLPLLRFKDLRHLLPTAWNALKLPAHDLAPVLGHAKGSSQTARYVTAQVVGTQQHMDAVAGFLGLDRIHLRAG